MADKSIDVKGANCPIPILKAKKALADLPVGGTLEVFATDPGSVPDFQAFSTQTGNPLIEQEETGGVYRFVLKRAG
jgi:tRNA 2-thiouridine synthesizing protein A